MPAVRNAANRLLYEGKTILARSPTRALPVARLRVVIGPFREVTSDFGQVIAKVNALFGTRFLEFDHTDDNVRSAFEAIEADWATRLPPGVAFERKVGRPSKIREGLKEELVEE